MKLTAAGGGHKAGLSGRGVLLRALRDLGQASRTDLARYTGMQPSTISTLTGDLVRDGVLDEVASRDASPRGGRRQILLAVAGGRPAAVGLHIGVHYVSGAVIDARGEPLLTSRIDRPAEGTPAHAVDVAAGHVLDLLAEAGVDAHEDGSAAGIVGLGVTVPAAVERNSGAVLPDRSLGWPARVDLGRMLSERLALPVSVESSPYGQLLVERSSGGLRGVEDAVLVNVATTVRMAVLKGGRLQSPTQHFAAAIGHVPSNAEGPACFCGAMGCLNAVAGYDAISRRAGALLGRELAVREVDRLAAAGDEGAREVVHEAGRRIAEALVPILLVYEPNRVVIACPLAAIAAAVRAELQECVRRHAARLGDRAVEIGDATLAGSMGVGAAWLPIESSLYS
jgi:predicted NBD/HSP70 family sugar kinase